MDSSSPHNEPHDTSTGRESIEVVAEEFVAQLRGERDASVAEFARRYPHLADEIQALFPAMLLLEHAGRPSSEIDRDLSPQVDDASTDANAPAPTAAGTHGFPHQAAASTTPDRVGRFEIVRRLGVGGFATVFLARDPQLNREVALKVPKPHILGAPGAVERFEREAQAAGILSHPAIVPIFEAGHTGGLAYIASAYCPGATLAEWLTATDTPVTPRAAALLVARLADAVQHAHARGVIHRDLKPGNILLDVPSSEPIDPEHLSARVRVTDFGLAKYAGPGDQTITQMGDVLGTLAYMAPEQARGAIDVVGPATDIFALGTILYELLTGTPPHRQSSQYATMNAIQNEVARPPCQLNSRVPHDLDAICLKCLEKEPAARYATAHDLADDLRRFVAGEPVVARHATWQERTAKWCRRRPALSAALVAAAVFLVTGLCLTSWQWWRANQNYALASAHRATAIENLALANTQRRRAEANVRRAGEAIDRMLAETAAGLDNVPQMEQVRARMLEVALRLQSEMLAEETDDPQVRLQTAAAYRRIGQIRLLLGHPNEARVAVDAGLKIAMEFKPSTSDIAAVEMARLQLLSCTVAQNESQPDLAISAAESAVELLKPLVESSDEADAAMLLGTAYRDLGATHQRLGQIEEAIDNLTLANDVLATIAHERQHDAEYLFKLAQTTNSLAICLKSAGRLEDAEATYRQAIDIGQRLEEFRPEWREVRHQTAIASINLANLALWQRDYEQAAEFYGKAKTISERLAREFPSTPVFLHRVATASAGLGSALRSIGNPLDARAAFESAIAALEQLDRQSGTSESGLSAMSVASNNLGNLLRSEFDDLAAAEQAFDTARQTCERLVEIAPATPRHHNSLGLAHANLAQVALTRSDARAALEHLAVADMTIAKAIELEPGNARFHAARRTCLGTRTEALCALGRHGEAVAVLDEFDGRPGFPPPKAETCLRLARSLARNIRATQQDPNRATEQQQAAVDRYTVHAIHLIRRACELGFRDLEAYAAADLMTPLRTHPEFQQLLQSSSGFSQRN